MILSFSWLRWLRSSMRNQTATGVHRIQRRRPSRQNFRATTVQVLQPRLLLTTIVVNTNADTDAAGTTTLRDAIAQANSDNSGDTITFDSSLSGKTITLTQGVLKVSGSMTITGLGASELAIDGNNKSGIFLILDAAQSTAQNVTITGLTIQHGYENSNLVSSGAIFNAATLTLSDDTIANNSADAGTSTVSAGIGAGICNIGVLMSTNDIFTHNSVKGMSEGAAPSGGAIFNEGSLTSTNDTITNNVADSGDGGGIYCFSSPMTLTDDTISNNSAGAGGGIYVYTGSQLTTLDNCTISNNSAFRGGGITNYGGNVASTDDSIVDNTADLDGGGGIWNYGGDGRTPAGLMTSTGDTISGNSTTGFGGGVENQNEAWIATNDTIVDNSAATQGGGIYCLNESFTGTFVTTVNDTIAGNSSGTADGAVYISAYSIWNSWNTIVAANPTGGDVAVENSHATINLNNTLIGDSSLTASQITSGTGNLFDPSNQSIFVTGTDGNPLLADNGGETQTVALSVNSPAIGAGGELTTLGADITSPSASTIAVNNVAPFAVGDNLKIDHEIVTVTAVDSSNNQLTVLRGQMGTAAAMHDHGAIIQLAYDQRGVLRTGSDLGAYAPSAAMLTPSVISINANGGTTVNTTASWIVTFNEPVTGVNPTDFKLVRTGSVDDTLTQITGSGSTYTLTASNVSGDGTLGLNLVDNDSIMDSNDVPLGGVGAGNGDFTGQILTVQNTFPAVISIDRTTPASSTTNASSVTYTVTFSEPVTGVDSADFSTPTTGTVAATGTSVSSIDASTYTVTISGITGIGTLGLNLVDNGTIHDLAGNPLQNPSLETGFQKAAAYNPSAATEPVNVADMLGNGKLAVGDFNGDGIRDMALVVQDDQGNTTVSVELGNTNGTFQAPVQYPVAPGVSTISTADLNGDGKLDLIFVNTESDSVNVMIGNGDGTFQPVQFFGVGPAPSTLQIADLNDDGTPDLIVGNNDGTISVLLGNGDGTFQAQQTYAVESGPTGIAVGDVSGDGKLDLIVTCLNGGTPTGVVTELPGNGDGTFQSQKILATGLTFPTSLTMADLNGDGKLDFVIGDGGSRNLTLFQGNGDGTFQSPQTLSVNSLSYGVAIADLNGDGRPDIVDQISNGIDMLLGEGSGDFQGQVYTYPGPVLTGLTVSNITGMTATLGATVASSGGSNLTAVGFVYALTSENPDPQLGGSDVINLPVSLQQTGNISAGLTGLTPGSNYTFEAYATNNSGTTYSAPVSTFYTSSNHAPTGTSGTITTVEDTAYVVKASDFGFMDPDVPPNAFLAVKFTTLPNVGTFTDNGTPLTANQFVNVSDINAGKLVFTPNQDYYGPYFAARFQVQDDGGIANGGVNLDPNPKVLDVNILPQNHAPTGTSTTITTVQDTPYVVKVSDFGFMDTDIPSNAFVAVKFSTLPNAGSFTDHGVPLSANQFVSVSDIAAGKLVFTPKQYLNGTFFAGKFQVQDNGSLANGGADLDPIPKVMEVNLLRQNHAPLGTSGTVTAAENIPYVSNIPYVIRSSDFGFSDPGDVPANQLLAVKFVLLPNAGVITDNLTEITPNQVVSAADINEGRLQFWPSAYLTGTFFLCKFQVQDNGGTANGGQDLDSNPKVLDVKIVPVNHAPVGTSGTVTGNENSAYVFSTSDFGFTDPNDFPPNNLLAVKFTILPQAGSLTDDGVALQVDQFVSAADIKAGKLVFTPNSNLAGTFFLGKFQVEDDGGTANGGMNLDPIPKILDIRLTPR